MFRLMRRKLTRSIILLVVVVALGGVLFAQLCQGVSGEQITLQGVDAADLAENGVSLLPAEQGALVAITLQQAKETALDRYEGTSVKEAVLGHVRTARWDTNAWVVSLDPNGFDHSGRGGTTLYLLSFVDAVTGDLLFTISEASPPTEGWNYPPEPPATVTPSEPPPQLQ